MTETPTTTRQIAYCGHDYHGGLTDDERARYCADYHRVQMPRTAAEQQRQEADR